MKSKRSDSLIVKYLNHSINADELDELISWLEQPGNKDIFKDYVKINYSIDYKLGDYRTEAVNEYLQGRIRKEKKASIRRRVLRITKYAAIVTIIFGAFYFYRTEFSAPIDNLPYENDGSITLQLGNGRSVILKEEATGDIVSEKGQIIGKQVKHGIEYKGKGHSELNYNTLNVPYGKKFQLTLSDGTKVFLNAGSSIKFPVTFIQGNDRAVFLSGEAFFDVTKGRDPFIVNTDYMDLTVLGTRFNVSTYPDEPSIHTVLVEGSVQLRGKDPENSTTLVLLPEHEAIWRKNDEQIEVAKADIESTMAWMNGQLVFRGVPFKDIVKKLERSYNCTIINNNRPLNEEIFSATFNVDIESIEQVMAYISKNSPFHYTMGEDRIIKIN